MDCGEIESLGHSLAGKLGLDPSNLAHLSSITQHKHKNLNFNNASVAHLSPRGR
jgi:hypothetical protein